MACDACVLLLGEACWLCSAAEERYLVRGCCRLRKPCAPCLPTQEALGAATRAWELLYWGDQPLMHVTDARSMHNVSPHGIQPHLVDNCSLRHMRSSTRPQLGDQMLLTVDSTVHK